MMKSDTMSANESLRARGLVIPLSPCPLVMGIINVTPDSFWDGGRYVDPVAAVDHAERLVEEGADLLDIGAESSRPGSRPIDVEEEVRRLIPVVQAISQQVTVPISIDTTKAEVALRALNVGASIINDISALRFDPNMGQVVAANGAGLVLMHMQGTPATMQESPQYDDVVKEVGQFLLGRVKVAEEAGIGKDQILLDPGIGFGKTVEHNLALLARLGELTKLGRPIMVGVSRKAFIGRVLGKNADKRLMGTAGSIAIAVSKGVRVVRVHDVDAIRDVLKMLEAIGKATNPHE